MLGRGTTDDAVAVRQLMEKQQDVQKELHMIFIDLERRRMGGFDDKGFEVYVEAGYARKVHTYCKYTNLLRRKSRAVYDWQVRWRLEQSCTIIMNMLGRSIKEQPALMYAACGHVAVSASLLFFAATPSSRSLKLLSIHRVLFGFPRSLLGDLVYFFVLLSLFIVVGCVLFPFSSSVIKFQDLLRYPMQCEYLFAENFIGCFLNSTVGSIH